MNRGMSSPARWRAAAAGAQVALVVACGAVGWQLLHQGASSGAVTVKRATGNPPTAPMANPSAVPGMTVQHRAGAAPRPGLEELLARVNRDDSRLYRSQWATIQLVAAATHDYLTARVVPLLLAAARGGAH